MSVVAEEIPVKQSYKYVGTRPVRHDGLEKVNGKARFAADMTKPRMIHGHVLRSPYAHAKILSIDTSKAETMPGVKAVVTASDFPLPEKKRRLPTQIEKSDCKRQGAIRRAGRCCHCSNHSPSGKKGRSRNLN